MEISSNSSGLLKIYELYLRKNGSLGNSYDYMIILLFLIFFLFRLTKCTFHKYGHSGTIEKHDALCLLATNIISEKIYVFLWFWLIILAVLTACYLIYTIAIIAVPSMRKIMLQVLTFFYTVWTVNVVKEASPPKRTFWAGYFSISWGTFLGFMVKSI